MKVLLAVAGAAWILVICWDAFEAIVLPLLELRRMYEPYVVALSGFLLMPLPGWGAGAGIENWRTTAWSRLLGDARHPADLHDEDW